MILILFESLNDSNNQCQLCTETSCTEEDDEGMIKCSKCKRAVHFRCTKLPFYQLRLFFTKSYRTYVCVNCGTVPEEFQKFCQNQEENLFEQLKREVDACENIIKVQNENQEKANKS